MRVNPTTSETARPAACCVLRNDRAAFVRLSMAAVTIALLLSGRLVAATARPPEKLALTNARIIRVVGDARV